MSDNNLLRRLLIDEEGCKLEAHQDSEKKLWHVGIGHNLEIDQTDEELACAWRVRRGRSERTHYHRTTSLHDLFHIDVQDAIEDVHPFFTP